MRAPLPLKTVLQRLRAAAHLIRTGETVELALERVRSALAEAEVVKLREDLSDGFRINEQAANLFAGLLIQDAERRERVKRLETELKVSNQLQWGRRTSEGTWLASNDRVTLERMAAGVESPIVPVYVTEIGGGEVAIAEVFPPRGFDDGVQAASDFVREEAGRMDSRHEGEAKALLEEVAAAIESLFAESLGTYQERVRPWLVACFGETIAIDTVERNHRFLEEALELVQALGCTRSEALQLVAYVYDRDVGDPDQEVGGVMNTLAALCLAHGLDMHAAGERELARVWKPEILAKIRAKQAAKPKHSPLPEAVDLDRSAAGMVRRIGEVASAVAFQAGEPESELAGMILSTLVKRPDLVDRFIVEGSGLLVDGEIGPLTGVLSFRSIDGKIRRPEEVAAARAAEEDDRSSCLLCGRKIEHGEKTTYDPVNGETACVDCAPTYADLLREPESFLRGHDEEPHTAETAKAVFDAHIAAGGSASDKWAS